MRDRLHSIYIFVWNRNCLQNILHVLCSLYTGQYGNKQHIAFVGDELTILTALAEVATCNERLDT